MLSSKHSNILPQQFDNKRIRPRNDPKFPLFSSQSKLNQFGCRLTKSVIAVGTVIGGHHLTSQQCQHHEVEAPVTNTIPLNVNEASALKALAKRYFEHQNLEYGSNKGSKSSLVPCHPSGQNMVKLNGSRTGSQLRHQKNLAASPKLLEAVPKKKGKSGRGPSKSFRRKVARCLKRNNKREALKNAVAVIAMGKNEQNDNTVNAGASLTIGLLGAGDLKSLMSTNNEKKDEKQITRSYEPLFSDETAVGLPLDDLHDVEANGQGRHSSTARNPPESNAKKWGTRLLWLGLGVSLVGLGCKLFTDFSPWDGEKISMNDNGTRITLGSTTFVQVIPSVINETVSQAAKLLAGGDYGSGGGSSFLDRSFDDDYEHDDTQDVFQI